MRYFQDTGLLILYSFLALFFIDPDSRFIFALLCTIILMCCCYMSENRILISILFVIYGLITLQLKEFLLFYPIFIYVILYQCLWPFVLWAVIKHVLRAAFSLLNTLLEDVMLFPELGNLFLPLHKL